VVIQKHRLHQLIIGDSNELKSKLADTVRKIVSGVRYVDVQSSDTSKLFAWVDKKEKMLRLGPILMAQDSICILNGVDKMPYSQQYRLKEIIDDGVSTANGHKIRANICFIAMVTKRSKVMILDRFDIISSLKTSEVENG
jgi:DNA replicative helicase MCM subunit Mcm2 (Cdc46/Mcm family)